MPIVQERAWSGSAGPALLAALLLSAAAVRGVAGQEPVRLEGSDGTWVLPANAHRAVVDGRDAIEIARGAPVLAGDVDFASGTIEFDVRADDATLFMGVLFRRDPSGDAERVYLRPFNSTEWNAVQYDPGIRGGTTWQLYPELNAAATLPRHAWIHVRLDVDGTRLEVRIGNGDAPTLVVERMRGVTERGGLGFWATNGNDDRTTAAVSRVVVRPREARATQGLPSGDEAGTLSRWELSGVRAAPAEGPVREVPTGLSWRAVTAEEAGLVSLTRHLGPPPRGTRATAWARTRLRADRARSVPLDLGYSDDVTVFLDGRPLYSGHGGWSTRYPGFFGALRRGFETVWLPLQAGDNELVLAISDGLPFGWGFAARLLETDGVEVEGSGR